jgi:hypothetical protein
MKDYRKFTVAMIGLVMAFVLALMGKLTSEFVAVDTAAVGAFTAGNVLEHLKEVWKGRSAT